MSESAKRGLPVRVKMRHEAHFVEELAARHSAAVGHMEPVSAIEPDPEQPRASMGDLSELVGSIRDKGVLEPILVRPLAEATGRVRYRIISGERRYRAAVAAGLHEVPVIAMHVGEDEALEIALVENLQRKDLTPFEEAAGYKALGERHGYTHEDIATAVGRSRTVVTETLRLLAMPPRARDVVEALGIHSKSLLLEIARAAKDEPEMIHLLEQAAARGLSREDFRAAGRATDPKGKRAKGKPYIFRFRSPDKTYQLALSFRKSAVDRHDLITALEAILRQVKSAKD